MIGMFNDYYRRSVRERTEQYRANAVANGIAPFPNLPVPFYKGPDKRIAVNWDLVPIVQRAFEMRAETPAKSLTVIRKFLADHGIVLTNRGVNAMLQNRLMIGELRFGRYVNETAVPPVIEPALFRRVQEAIIPRGRRAVSEMLLARQAILYCASCGSKMVGGCVKNGRHKSEYRTYRCPNSDCPARATISAHNVELLVREEAARLWGERQGRASVDKPLAAVRERRDAAREALDAAVEAFTGIEVASARAKLLRLQQELDEASDEYDELVNATVPLETFSISANFDELTLEQWRDAIRLVIGRVEVKRGRLEIVDKVTVIPRS
jgi:hypothetical protein